ncbi:MAG: tol-pal system protein YbgF [Myxococcales bacterium]|nr:MAG: tol-pal system protein YbgF [Myxococcales bacterium]
MLTACSGGHEDASDTANSSAETTQGSEVSELRLDNQEQQERIRELESRIALIESEARELRTVMASDTPAKGQTVVISRQDPHETDSDVAAEEWNSSEEDDSLDAQADGPRPMLRLYGAPSLGSYEEGTAAPQANSAKHPSIEHYLAALTLVSKRHYAQAYEGFASFLKKYPKHPYADNALYWMGEVRYAMGQYELAIKEFELALRYFPKGNKISDVILKMAYSYSRIGNAKKAGYYFRKLTEEYPDSRAAMIAAGQEAS